ncbi:calmodulin-like protein 11, partial [Eurytemora carolleeae]|uniref:calmodulin-like protein 11 n=1 Tax=Eurytemora carolleeae TaxID=1294199 RepID=UPI000C7560D3
MSEISNVEIEATEQELQEPMNRGLLRSELQAYLVKANNQLIKHQAFKLFDLDGDGEITIDELRSLIEKVGGSMTEGEAKALIKEADKDGNEGVDYTEFTRLWSAIRGEGEEEK